MSTLLDECRAAAPAWMVAEGTWFRGVSADHREWQRWERAVWEHTQSGRGWCAEIAVERNAAGWCHVSAQFMPPSPPADEDEGIGPEAQGPDLSRALVFVAAEVRAEMVARGLAKAEKKHERGCDSCGGPPSPGRWVHYYPDGEVAENMWWCNACHERRAAEWEMPAGLSVTSDDSGVPR